LVKHNHDLLKAMGGDPMQKPPILEKFYYGSSPKLTGSVVDDAPLSETNPLRPLWTDNENYIDWLPGSPLETNRIQDFYGARQPTALVYLMLRHAMMLTFWDAGIRFLENRRLVTPDAVRVEPSFVHVRTMSSGSESKFKCLYDPTPGVSKRPL